MTRPLCIYHGNCADGFGSAWVVWKYFGGDCDFHPGVYQDSPPDVTDRDVIMVDFSYKRPVLEEMIEKSRSLLVLDHHRSAMEDLVGFPEPASNYPAHVEGLRVKNHAKVGVLFDMERSGAGITWDYFFNNAERPPLINHIEDRDLWRFNLPGTRDIQANLFSYPYSFEAWDGLMDCSPEELRDFAEQGAAIERKHHKDVAELVKVCQRPMRIGGYEVPAASLPYTLTSDAGHLMCTQAEGVFFAACYWDTLDGRVFSLRSQDDGLDVSKIAAVYGGGGHKNASGFRVPFAELDVDGSPEKQE